LVVLPGDTPLMEAKTIKQLLIYHEQQQAKATVLSAELPEPYGYGRIIRDDNGGLKQIIEEKDASPQEKLISEINTGIYCFKASSVFSALSQINTSNAQGEYYLTDVLPILKEQCHKVAVLAIKEIDQIYGINDRVQLSQAESIIRTRKKQDLMRNGLQL
jgi:bifunctional UDP-N-acetylglucosamine pyrophosphorylase/glucosamine-1-phosphate N-acetyltransferase